MCAASRFSLPGCLCVTGPGIHTAVWLPVGKTHIINDERGATSGLEAKMASQAGFFRTTEEAGDLFYHVKQHKTASYSSRDIIQVSRRPKLVCSLTVASKLKACQVKCEDAQALMRLHVFPGCHKFQLKRCLDLLLRDILFF